MRRPTRSELRDVVGVLLGLLLVLLVLVGASRLVRSLNLADVEAFREFVLGFGPLAPVVFILVQAAQVVIAPIPGQALALVSGYLFGPIEGTVYSVVGATLGSFVAFSLSRRYGRPYVERTVPQGTLERMDAFLDRHGLFGLFLAFLIPGLPDDAICFVGGLSELDVRSMVAVSAVGRIPGYFVINLAGAQLVEYRAAEAALLLGGLALVSIVVYLLRDRLPGGQGRPS